MIGVRGKIGKRHTLLPRTMIFPTVKAIRTLEAFARESDEAIAHELQKLTSGE